MTQFIRSADPMGRYRGYLTSSSSRRRSSSFVSKRAFSNSQSVSLRILCSISFFFVFPNCSTSCFMLMAHLRMQPDISVRMQTKAMWAGSEPLSDNRSVVLWLAPNRGQHSRLHLANGHQKALLYTLGYTVGCCNNEQAKKIGFHIFLRYFFTERWQNPVWTWTYFQANC